MDEYMARNELLLLMVLIQNVHVFNCRSERTSAFKIPLNRNYMLIFGVLAAQLLHIASMQIPFMQNVLGVGPIPFDQWLICLGLAISVLIVMEVYKLVLKKI
jgi:magnesium-transporting ATPase (P-type)